MATTKQEMDSKLAPGEARSRGKQIQDLLDDETRLCESLG